MYAKRIDIVNVKMVNEKETTPKPENPKDNPKDNPAHRFPQSVCSQPGIRWSRRKP